jgi:hypothetical protein
VKTKLLGLIAACALLGSTVAANASPYVVTLEEVGSNVVATGSGAIDLTGLESLIQTTADSSISPCFADIYTGATPTFGNVTVYAGSPSSPLSGPSSFGNGLFDRANSGTGDMVGLESPNALYLPTNYTSDSALSDGALYDNATFASLGVTPGTYVWTWGPERIKASRLRLAQHLSPPLSRSSPPASVRRVCLVGGGSERLLRSQPPDQLVFDFRGPVRSTQKHRAT